MSLNAYKRTNSDDLLDDIEAHASQIIASEIDEERARELARSIAIRISEEWGGEQPYISKGRFRLRQRDEAIFAAFSGNNVDELRRRFGLSSSRIYAIVKMVRARRGM